MCQMSLNGSEDATSTIQRTCYVMVTQMGIRLPLSHVVSGSLMPGPCASGSLHEYPVYCWIGGEGQKKGQLSFSQLKEEVATIAAALSGVGVVKGDIVAG